MTQTKLKRGPKPKHLPPRRSTTVRALAALMDELEASGHSHSEAYRVGILVLLGKPESKQERKELN